MRHVPWNLPAPRSNGETRRGSFGSSARFRWKSASPANSAAAISAAAGWALQTALQRLAPRLQRCDPRLDLRVAVVGA